MRKYQSHKIVEAGRVLSVGWRDPEGWHVYVDTDEGDTLVKLNDEEYQRLVSGNDESRKLTSGYLVRYSDGYISWSPAAPFEEGYTLVPDET